MDLCMDKPVFKRKIYDEYMSGKRTEAINMHS